MNSHSPTTKLDYPSSKELRRDNSDFGAINQPQLYNNIPLIPDKERWKVAYEWVE